MSHLATPLIQPPAPVHVRRLVSPVAVIAVCLSVFALLCAILAYAVHHGRDFDPEELARQAARSGDRGDAQVVHVETKPQQRP